MTNDDRPILPPQTDVDTLLDTDTICANLMSHINRITDDHAERYADAIHDAILGRM